MSLLKIAVLLGQHLLYILSHSQCEEPEHPDAELGGQEVPGAGLATGPALALGEDLVLSRHQVPVAVDHLAPVVHRPAEAAPLQHIVLLNPKPNKENRVSLNLKKPLHRILI